MAMGVLGFKPTLRQSVRPASDPAIQKHRVVRQCKFVWGCTSPYINLHLIDAPKEEGSRIQLAEGLSRLGGPVCVTTVSQRQITAGELAIAHHAQFWYGHQGCSIRRHERSGLCPSGNGAVVADQIRCLPTGLYLGAIK